MQSAAYLNAFIERFVRSIKEECLDRVIPLGEAHLRELIHEYDHAADGPLVRRERLGGVLNYYYREAA
jgi:hypothetical protein